MGPATRVLSPKSVWESDSGLEPFWLTIIQHPCHQGKEVNTVVKRADGALIRVVNKRKVVFILMVR